MSKIEIIPAKDILSFLTFCKIPRLLYTGEIGFAPSLDADPVQNFSTGWGKVFIRLAARPVMLPVLRLLAENRSCEQCAERL